VATLNDGSAKGRRNQAACRRNQTTGGLTSETTTLYLPNKYQCDDPMGESGFVETELMKPEDRDRMEVVINENDNGGKGKWNASTGKRYSSGSKKQRADVTTFVPLTCTNLSANPRRVGANHLYEKIPYGDRSASRLPTDLVTLSSLEEGTKYQHSGRRVMSGTMSLQHKPKSSEQQQQLTSDETRSLRKKYPGQNTTTASLDRRQTPRTHSSVSAAFTPPAGPAAGNVGFVTAEPVSKTKRQSLQQSRQNAPPVAFTEVEEVQNDARREKPEELLLSVHGLKFINRRSNPIEVGDYGAAGNQSARMALKLQRSISADTRARRVSSSTTAFFKPNAAPSRVEEISKHTDAKTEIFKPKFRLIREKLREVPPLTRRETTRSEKNKPNKTDNVQGASMAALRRSNDSFVTAPSDDSASQREPSTSVAASSMEDVARPSRPRRSRKKSAQLSTPNRTKNHPNENYGKDDVFVKSQKQGRLSRTRRSRADESYEGVTAPTGAVSVATQDYILLQETYSPDDLKLRDGDADELAKLHAHRVTVPITMTLAVLAVYVGSGTLLFSAWENVNYLVGSYFCFMTLTTIGFGGDVIPGDGADNTSLDEKRIACSVWLACGLSVVAMCVNLAHERFVDRCDRDHVEVTTK